MTPAVSAVSNMKHDDQSAVVTAPATAEISSYYQHARPEIVARVPLDASRILDIGCGAGGLAAMLRLRQQAEFHGIEIVEQAANLASSQMTRVWNCPVEAAIDELPDGYYDCIVVADVLEHLVDPLTVLSRLRSKLAPEGHLIASVPNIQNWSVISELLQGRWVYRDEGILDRTHLRFFTRRSFSEMLWSAGYRIQSIGETRNDRRPPEKLLASLRDCGFSSAELVRDSATFQFLVDATLPPERPEPKVIVIVLNWNGKADTIECVRSLSKLHYHNFETVVVDNGSTDGSVPAIRLACPNIELVETGRNLGYAGGNNVGIRWALERGTEYVLVINNDTMVNSGLLNGFIRAAELAPEAGIYGAKIFQEDAPDRLWFAGGEWCPDQLDFKHIGGDQPDSPEFDGYRQWDYITGCVLFVDARVFAQVGLFDESFYLTYEETDWCYRARQKGFRCLFVPQAKVWHKVSASFGGATSPLVTYFLTRNKLLWASKHLGADARTSVQRKTWRALRDALVPTFRVSATVPAPKNYYWAATEWLRDARRSLANPNSRAMLYGLRDYYLRRLGDCPARVRTLAAATKH